MNKIQSREAMLKQSSFQYGMKISIENEISIPGPSLAAEKQGLGLKFSIENENFKPRMKISSENENFVRGGMVFSCVRARMNFSTPGPSGLGKGTETVACQGSGKKPIKASVLAVLPEVPKNHGVIRQLQLLASSPLSSERRERYDQKTFRYLWRLDSLLFRDFFVAFPWLFRGPRFV